MWWNRRKQKRMERLFDELRSLAMLDRLCSSETELTGDERLARQRRQSELLLEIERLRPQKARMSTDDRLVA
jgi:hypothetical protein